MYSLQQVAAVGVAALLVWLLFGIIYRLLYHPLARYPGPILSRISGIPQMRAAWDGYSHERLRYLHEEYGDVVRYAPSRLSFRTIEALRDIYEDRKVTPNLVKTGFIMIPHYLYGRGSLHSMVDRDEHSTLRRLIQHALSDHALKESEELAISRIRSFCDLIGKSARDGGWTKAQNLTDWTNLLTVDILGELSFGASFGSLEAEHSPIPSLLKANFIYQQRLAYLPLMDVVLPFIRKNNLLQWLQRGSDAARKRIEVNGKVKELVDARLKKEQDSQDAPPGEVRKDFYHYLFHARDHKTGRSMQPHELLDVGATFLGAGTDTIAAGMAAIFFYLTQNPRCLQKLQKEVRDEFGTDIEDIKTGSRLASLKYLRVCIDEALRITAPIPGILERRVLPGGAVIGGHPVPEGMTVTVCPNVIHHNPNYFWRSGTYWPERWILGSRDGEFVVTEQVLEDSKSAFHAFSDGTRGCIGKNMAYIELLTTTARMAYLYDWRRSVGDRLGDTDLLAHPVRQRPGEYKTLDWFITQRDGPLIEFRKRQT